MKRYNCTCYENNDKACLAHAKKMSRTFYKQEEENQYEADENEE